MLVEKYIVIGIKYPKDYISDVIKQPSYNGTFIIDPITVVREQRDDIFIDFGGPYITKSKAFDRINVIRWNLGNIRYFSVLPIVTDVSVQEARYLKLLKLNKKLKRR
jgi:hypothetical protein